MRRVAVPERVDWKSQAEHIGFIYHTQKDGRPYWNEAAVYEFSLFQIEEHVENAAADLQSLCLEFVARAVEDEAILSSLDLPRFAWTAIRESWKRGDRHLYGRFDFAYDGKSPPKLLEYNADTPTALFETGYFQWKWLEDQIAHGVLPTSADQFNSVHEKLIEAFKQLRQGQPYFLHFACMAHAEDDLGTIAYLADCARQAGVTTQVITMENIGLTPKGLFVDESDKPIEMLFKLYPWEWMLNDEFGKAIPTCRTQFIEPLWKAILSNKGILPHLYAMAPDHPNLLPAYFDDDPRAAAIGPDYVRKPCLSREGANLRLVNRHVTVETGGPYEHGRAVRQAIAPVPEFGGNFPVIGAWMVANEPAGMLVRESDGPITTETARAVPHFIKP
jgi:glutathionylspermidine synthase